MADDEEEEDPLKIVGHDPLSLVSIGLEEQDDEDGSGQLFCQICDHPFPHRRLFRRHVRLAHAESCVQTCRCCGEVFAGAEALKEHLIKVHKVNKVNFSSADSDVNPILKPRLTLVEEVQSCPECALRFANQTSLNIHRLRRHISKRMTKNVPCPVCQEHADDLTAHCRREHNTMGVVCPYCARILSKACTLNRHIEQVHLNLQIHKKVQCPQCSKIFSKKGHLDRHIKTIHKGLKDTSEPCPICGKVFTTKSSLEPHIEMVHRGVRKKCPECGKELSDLWKHMRTVHGQYRRREKIAREDFKLPAEEEKKSLKKKPKSIQ